MASSRRAQQRPSTARDTRAGLDETSSQFVLSLWRSRDYIGWRCFTDTPATSDVRWAPSRSCTARIQARAERATVVPGVSRGFSARGSNANKLGRTAPSLSPPPRSIGQARSQRDSACPQPARGPVIRHA